MNLGLATRANLARDVGADIFLSIHFNAYNYNVRGTEAHIDHTGNYNKDEDLALAKRVDKAVYKAIHEYDNGAVDRGGKDERGLDVLSDFSFGNTSNYHPVRGALVEVEFIDVKSVDELLNTNANHVDVRSSITKALAESLIEDLQSNPKKNEE